MYAGFDIGGTSARASLYDDQWQSVGSERRRVREATEPAEIAELIRSMLRDLTPGGEGGSLDGLGIGLAAQLGPEGRVVRNSPNLGWRDEPFVERLEEVLGEEFGAPSITLVNDLNALLWGEYSGGALGDVEDALAVYVGTGVGGGLLVQGDLVRGAEGVAGEIGHSKVEPGGRLCGCGERGCVEAYAGGIHLERQVADVADEELEEAGVVDEGAVDLSVADELSREHPKLGEIWRRATDYLALVAANACTLLNPAVLLVGGGVVDHCDHFRERFLAKTTPLVLEVARESLEIRRPQLGDDAGVLGAARLAVGE